MAKIEVGNLSVAVDDVGDGPPVVLLHGLACGKRMWFQQIRALRKRFRVIAYDLRGHGLTDAPVAATGYSAAHLTRDLVGVLDALKIERAVSATLARGIGTPDIAKPGIRPATTTAMGDAILEELGLIAGS